jgi:hypothetical protein
LISAPELSKHLTTSQCPKYDATNNGDRPCLVCKLISASELSKHLTIAQCPRCDATNNGDRINLRDEGGRSPLFEASHYGHCDVVKCLLSSDADINLCDEDGQSSLCVASKRGYCDVSIL